MFCRQLPNINLLISLGLFSSLSIAQAATFTVTTTADSGAGSLRQAILDANTAPGADTISFSPGGGGTIYLSSGEIPISGELTINGPGPAVLAISGTSSSRIFNIADGSKVSINGLKLTEGTASGDGGAILSSNDSSPLGSTLTLSNCVLSGNSASRYGGALSLDKGDVTITDSLVSDNSANESCGGLRNAYSVMTITNSTIANNTAASEGGGICTQRNTTGVLKGTLIVTNSTVSGNQAGNEGGGIRNVDGIVNVTNSTLSGNIGHSGGGLYTKGALGSVKIINSTVSGNKGGSSGAGGLQVDDGKLQFGNTLVAGNSTLRGYANIYKSGGTAASLGNNLFGVDGKPGLYGFTPLATDITPPAGVILSKIIGLLADNGGPTKTHLLVVGSPAIDKGNNTLAAGLTTDQRGVGFPRIVNTTVDIGAVEGTGGGGTTFTLSVDKRGGNGTVTSTPAGIACGATCDADFAEGAQVTLAAIPATGFGFTGWTGDDDCTGTTCVLTMKADKSVTALFTNAVPNKLLRVIKDGNGTGTVTGDGINCGTDCTQSYATGTIVTLTAAPASGSSFAGWIGCTMNPANIKQCMVEMNTAKTVKAIFNKPTLLTVRKVGRGTGTVVSLPIGILCGTKCTQLYPYNTEVYLMAIPATGSTLTGWTTNCPAAYPGLKQVCKATMDQAKTVTATFTK
ncbi:MAG: InlB B-repeat-containing protein [Candidatus Competibacteraceae bacterium]